MFLVCDYLELSHVFWVKSFLLMFVLNLCVSVYSRAEDFCKEYRQMKGPGSTAKPSEQLFFKKLGTFIKNTLEKCQRENGFMWVKHGSR